MKAKPKAQKYRNLTARGSVIYYQRLIAGRRIQFSLKTPDWNRAAARRDLYEQAKGIGRLAYEPVEMPRFGEFAARYLSEDTDHLAPTTKGERERELKPEGPVLARFGHLHLDEITEARIREWWTLEVQQTGRSTKTGRNYLNALSAVLGYARELGLLDANPVRSFREILSRKTRTQRGRLESEPGRDIHPIEEPEEIERLVEAAKDEDPDAHLLVLLMLDGGLRLGEALGLRWGSIVWGDEEDDLRRALEISESRPRGGAPGPTKSGRERRVALSRRLRCALADVYRARFAPSPEVHVLTTIEPNNFRKRSWRRILKRADIGRRRMKDLRDTFASQLLTAGVPLGYVSRQLGHADVGVTVRHYARYVSDDYREPPRLKPGEVPADLLARLGEPHHTHITREDDLGGSVASARDHSSWWRAQHDLNVRPPGPQPGALSN